MTAELTLSDHLDEWLLIRSSRLQPRTIEGYRKVIRNYLEPQLGDLSLDELDVRTLESTYSRLLRAGGRGGRPLSPKSVRGIAAVLATALEHAVRTGLLETNPCRLATVPTVDHRGERPERPELRVWSADETRRFLDLVRGERFEEAFVVALGTGMRRSELLGLRWEDVDFPNRTIHVRRSLSVIRADARLKSPKSARPRALRVDDRVLAALRERKIAQEADRRRSDGSWRDEWGLVFTRSDGRYVAPGLFSEAWARLVRRLDVPVIRLHDLRHTHATLMLQAGVPIKVVSERLGHASIKLTVDTYMHVLPAMDAEAVEWFAALLDGEAEETGPVGSVSGWQRVRLEVPAEIRRQLEETAAETGLAVGDLVRRAIRRWLEGNAETTQLRYI